VKKFQSTSDTLKTLQQFKNYGNDAKNTCDFCLVFLKVCREFDDVTSAGKPFHVQTPIASSDIFELCVLRKYCPSSAPPY